MNNHWIKQKAFTLIELLIVITVIGILSMLLFRTLWDMITTNARIQQEKIINQEVINLQTTLNNLSEQYPIIAMSWYQSENATLSGDIGEWGFTPTLYLTNRSWELLSIYATGWDCNSSWCYMAFKQWDNEEVKITNPDYSSMKSLLFKVTPTQYYTSWNIYENLDLQNITAQWFWIFGTIEWKKKGDKPVSSYTLQHFTNLQQ